MTLPQPSRSSFLLLALVAGVLAPATLPAQDDALASRYILELQQMREELRELRGLVESQAQEIENLKRRQRDQYLDLDRRLGELSAAPTRPSASGPIDARVVPGSASTTEATAESATDPAGTEPAVEAPPPPSALPEVRDPIDAEAEITTLPAANAGGTRELAPPTEAEQQAYDQAFLALRETRYADAAEGFDRFLRDHPQSSYAPNALYWLGEVYYVTRDFETALGQFQRLLERYPGSGKQPDALLKAGFSHYELGQWAEARAALEQVVEQHPGTNYARLAENRLRTMRLEGRL